MWKLPVWAWAVVALVVIGAAAGAAGGNDDDTTAGGSTAAPVRTDADRTVPDTTVPEATTPEFTEAANTTAASATDAPTTTLSAVDAAYTDVPWENYDPLVQQRIFELVGAHDCAGLQDEFDTADANDDLQRNRTGTGNAALMTYLNELLMASSC